jgi:hypothetical protein
MLAASEENPAVLQRSVPLPCPGHGEACRVELGRSEIVLERCRGSFALLWSDGREARRYILGLSSTGQLSIELRAPRMPLQVVPRETITVVPGARLRGFVCLPLVPTVVWRDGVSKQQNLLELHPPALQGHWHEERGHVAQCSASWLVRFPFQSGEPQVVVPLRIYNDQSEPACPGNLEMTITDDDLIELRGAILVSPKRLRWSGSRMVEASS